ncbi:MAG: sugar transferase [Acutalibacteraceae bacterium]|jgi:undecaprenyl phosphate N,N'-diacetylbacillosamine 1-phosphate transferase
MYKKFIKRIIDIALSLLTLPLIILLIIIIGGLIFFEDRGNIFYNAPRLGKNGKIFKMYKFRSMTENAQDLRNEDGSTFNAEDDPRLTKIGKIIRKTSIDELPQLLNVLKGDMSLIGPRPDLPEHMQLYEGNEARKLEIKPGITGYSQAYFRNSIPWKERIQNDIYYIDNLTFIMDVKIILQTIKSIVKKDNVYIEG